MTQPPQIDADDLDVYPAEYFNTPFTENYSPSNVQKDNAMTIEQVIKDPRFKILLNDYYAGALAFMEKAGKPVFHYTPPLPIIGYWVNERSDCFFICGPEGAIPGKYDTAEDALQVCDLLNEGDT